MVAYQSSSLLGMLKPNAAHIDGQWHALGTIRAAKLETALRSVPRSDSISVGHE